MGMHSTTFVKGDFVTVIKGPFKGKQGTVYQVKGIVNKSYLVRGDDGVALGSAFSAEYLIRDKRTS